MESVHYHSPADIGWTRPWSDTPRCRTWNVPCRILFCFLCAHVKNGYLALVNVLKDTEWVQRRSRETETPSKLHDASSSSKNSWCHHSVTSGLYTRKSVRLTFVFDEVTMPRAMRKHTTNRKITLQKCLENAKRRPSPQGRKRHRQNFSNTECLNSPNGQTQSWKLSKYCPRCKRSISIVM